MIEVLKQALKAFEVATTPLAKDRQEVLEAVKAIKQAIAELESQEPVERNWREAPWGFGEKRLSTVEYSDIVSDGGLDPRNKFDTPPQRTEEPTKEMIDAAERIDWADSDVRGNIVNMWQAMSAVAPTPPQRTEQEPFAWDLADKVRQDLDRQSCQDAFMRSHSAHG